MLKEHEHSRPAHGYLKIKQVTFFVLLVVLIFFFFFSPVKGTFKIRSS